VLECCGFVRRVKKLKVTRLHGEMTNPEWWRDEKLPPVVGRAMDSDDGPQGRIYNCGYN